MRIVLVEVGKILTIIKLEKAEMAITSLHLVLAITQAMEAQIMAQITMEEKTAIAEACH